MSSISLSQSESEALLKMKKYSPSRESFNFPDFGGKLELKFTSEIKHEEFIINYTRHSIKLSKRNHNLRVRKIVGLARLDLDGPTHRNPDYSKIGPHHLHLYKEGYGLKWAFNIPEENFQNLDNAYETLFDFMKYCNVVNPPKITKGLFS